jgi:hypothetical protein
MGVRRLAVIAGCAIVILTGCGTQHAGSSSASVTSVVTRSPAQRAADDAASILTRFRPPPGAVSTGRLPVSALDQPQSWPGAPHLVTRTAWWRASGQQWATLSWLLAHPPAGMTMESTGGFIAKGTRVLPAPLPPGMKLAGAPFITFALPAIAHVLDIRDLLVAVAPDGAGHVAIRLDAQVAWLPPKPAAETIPPTATVVTVTPVLGFGTVSSRDHPVTITDQAQVRKIAAVVNALPVSPYSLAESCPEFSGRSMRLTFRATPDGPPLAVVQGDTTGCGTVSFTANGHQLLTLIGALSMQKQVMAIAGIHWAGFPAS